VVDGASRTRFGEVVESEKQMLLSVKEAAAHLGVGRDSVIRLIEQGELAAIVFPRMGGCGRNRPRRIELEELNRFKKRNTKGR
jgi:excisionase family DNA binding protein